MRSQIKSCEKFLCSNFLSNNQIRSQICTCQDSAAAVACEKSCPDFIVIFHLRTKCIFNSLRPGDAYMRQQTIQHRFRQWLVAWPAPSHYLNQCWDIVNWTRRNKLQWNFNRNSYLFIQENAFQNVAWKMTAIVSRPQCVNKIWTMIS